MLKQVIKNIRFKYAAVFLVLTVAIVTLIKIEYFTSLDVLRVIFAGFPLGRPMTMMAFILYVALIQFANIDVLLYYLKNDTYLIIRYERRERIFYRLLKIVFMINVFFIIIFFLATLISLLICGWSLNLIDLFEVLEIALRGFMTGIIFTVIQLLLLVRLEENNTFLFIMGAAVLFAFVSRLNLWVFTIFPVRLSGIETVINIILCWFYIIGGVLLFRKQYWQKEVG